MVETVTPPTKDCSGKPSKADIEAALVAAETTDPGVDEDQPDVIPDACERRVNRETKDRETDENARMEKADSPDGLLESSSSSDSDSSSSSSKQKKKSDAKPKVKAKAKASTTTGKAKAQTTSAKKQKKEQKKETAETTPASQPAPASSSKAAPDRKRPVPLDTSNPEPVLRIC